MADNTTTIDAAPAKEAATTDQPKATPAETVTLEKAMEAFGNTFSGRKNKPEVEKPAEPKKDEGKEKGADEDGKQGDAKDNKDEKLKEDVEATHKPKPRTKTSPKPALDETRLAEIAADAGARASTETISRMEKSRLESEKVDKPVVDSFKPPKEYVDQYQTFKTMAKSKPDKYGSLLEDFKGFVKEEEGYIKEWKRTHPGETWDGEADEHNDFYQRATPHYEDSDFRKAEIAVELGEARKELRKEVMDEVEPKLKKLDEMEQAETLRALQPAVATVERTAMAGILKAIDPAYEKFVEPAELEKLKDENPVAFDIALEVARDAVPFVAEVTRLWKSKGAVKAQENNPLHQYIHSYASKMMDLIKQLPAEDQLRDGKRFATWTEFNSLTPPQKERHWTVTDQDLIDRKMLDAQEIAKERTANEEKKLSAWATRKGMTNGSANNSLHKNVNEKKENEAKPLPVKENNDSPSVGSRTQVSPNAQASPNGTPAWVEQFGNILSGRKI